MIHCPNCTSRLEKKPSTGEGVKYCPRCGSNWYILETSYGKGYPDWSVVLASDFRENLKVSWAIFHNFPGYKPCPCALGTGKLYKDCCRDWWEGMEQSIVEGEKKND